MLPHNDAVDTLVGVNADDIQTAVEGVIAKVTGLPKVGKLRRFTQLLLWIQGEQGILRDKQCNFRNELK